MQNMVAVLTGIITSVLAPVVVAAALGGAWLLGRRGRLREERALLNRESEAALHTNVQLAEMARALDALVHEVERVAEAQRYTARLLTERAAIEIARPVEDPMRAPGRVVTPH
ncbi:MAG: hypothetical protein JJD97_01490 [Gemmatimonadaceae bacterium]|nr:hypothetical protein [Gemmatimonadaceae bacterium]